MARPPRLFSFRSSAKTANRVTIENDVWIGDNSVVLSGVTLPTGTIVGAGSVVTKSPEHPYSIIVGNPARHLRFRFERNLITRLLNSMWWEKDLEELSGGLPFNDPSAVVDILNKRGMYKRHCLFLFIYFLAGF